MSEAPTLLGCWTEDQVDAAAAAAEISEYPDPDVDADAVRLDARLATLEFMDTLRQPTCQCGRRACNIRRAQEQAYHLLRAEMIDLVRSVLGDAAE